MKKFLIFLANLTLIFNLSAQVTDPRDFVVLLDLGPALSVYRNSVVSVFLNVILKDYLNSSKLDEFHLIGFAQEPRLMFRETAFSRERVESFLIDLNRLPESTDRMDLIKGLDLAKDYLRALVTMKTKQVVLIMGGESPGGATATLWKKSLIDFNQYLRANKWRFRIVLLPYTGDQPDLDLAQIWKDEIPLTVLDESEDFANKLLGSPRIMWPEGTLRVGKTFKLPLKIINYEQENLLLRIRQIQIDGENALNRPISLSLSPNSTRDFNPDLNWINSPESEGEYNINIEIVFEDSNRSFPVKRRLTVEFTSSAGPILDLKLILLIIGLILVGVLITWLIIRLLHHRATGHRLSKVQAMKRLEKIRVTPSNLDRQTALAENKNLDRGQTTIKRESEIPRSALANARSQFSPSSSLFEESSRTKSTLKQTSTITDHNRDQPRTGAVTATVSTLSSRKEGPKEEDLTHFGKKRSSWEGEDTPRLSAAQESSGACTFLAEIWTDDFLFQNNIGKRGRFLFQVGDKKILGSPTGIPIKILKTPELGELTWDGEKLWFRALAQDLNFGQEPVNVLNKEIIWSSPGKKGLHIVLQPYISEAEKFKRFLRSLGKTNPDF